MVPPRDLQLHDGRTLRVHDAGGPDDAFVLVWHHGSPQTGALLEPLVAAAAARGIRLVSYARPSYGGSSPLPHPTGGGGRRVGVVRPAGLRRVAPAPAPARRGGGGRRRREGPGREGARPAVARP